MKLRFSSGIAVATLLSAVLLSGCTAQDQREDEDQATPSPTGTASATAANPVSGTYTGTQTIELGTPPAEATSISVEITCLGPGSIFLQDGAKTICGEKSKGTTSSTTLPLSPGQDSTEVKTSDPSVSYKAKIAYENK